MSDPVEQFWDDLLSRNPHQVRRAFATLDEDTRRAVIAHLERMVTEPDWHPEQVKSALVALRTIEEDV